MAIPPPADLTNIREKYTAEYVSANKENQWPQGRVYVSRNGEVIYEYERGYAFMKTFEPFRQLQGDTWHEYALISSVYTTFQVLDLESLEIVATRPYLQRSWYRTATYDQYEATLKGHPEYFEAGGYHAGKGPDDKINGEGFCPVEFYVPGLVEVMEIQSQASWDEHADKDWLEEMLPRTNGTTGFYSGCVWGDDSSMKLRAIDLSRISEGIVTDDERFGYWELPPGSLAEQIYVDYNPITINLAVPVDFTTGKASKYALEDVNWDKPDA